MNTLTLEEREDFYKDVEIKDFGPEEFIIKDGVLEHYNGTSVHVVIPDGVKKIADGAFTRGGAKAVKIESIVIPEGVEEICSSEGDLWGAFMNNHFLKKVVLPESLKIIGDGAFHWCTVLEEINFPKHIEYIGQSAFAHTLITHVEIPGTVKRIGWNAFYNCFKLEKLEFEDSSNGGIEIDTVFGCNDSLKEVRLPEGLETLQSFTFLECSALEKVILPQTLKKIDDGAFKGCSSLKDVEIPSGCTDISETAFINCNIENLETKSFSIKNGLVVKNGSLLACCQQKQTVIIPDEVTEICDYAFSGNKTLQKVVFPSALKLIGDSTFFGCSNLSDTNLEACKNVEKIGSEAFQGCRIHELNHKALQIHNGFVITDKLGMSDVEGGKMLEYCADCSMEEINVPDEVVELGEYAFYGFKNLKKITMKENVEFEPENTFFDCDSLPQDFSAPRWSFEYWGITKK